jgi:signal peptidase I
VSRRLLREVVLDAGAALGAACLVVALAHALFGARLLVFQSGSMAPAIETGALSLTVERPVDDIAPGDVVSVVGDDGVRVTHRVVEQHEGRLLLWGDANPAPDATTYAVDHADVVVASVPHLGMVLDRTSHGWWLIVEGGLAAVAVTLAVRRPRPGRRRLVRHHRLRAFGAALAFALVVTGPALRTMAAWNDTAGMTGTASSNAYFTCQAAATDVSPWLYWRLDEASTAGNAADSSGNGRTGTYASGVSAGTARACSRDTGSAVTLNGSSGYVYSALGAQPSATAGPNTFTVQIWFRTTTSRGGRLIGFGASRTGASSQYDRHLYLTDTGKVVFGVYPGGFQSVTSTDSYNDGTWHQAVGQVGAGGMKLFLDGEQVASNPGVTTAESYSGWWRVGYDNLSGWPQAPTSNFFAGSVDDAVVWHAALTGAQVLASYRAGR